MTEQVDPRAIRGKKPLGPQWHDLRDAHNAAVALLQAGDVDTATQRLRDVLAALEDTDDVSAWDLRARAQLNLASALEGVDTAAALEMTDEAIATASAVLERDGDEYGTRTVLVNALLSRAQTLAARDRLDDALAQISVAEEVLDAHEIEQADLMRFSAHSIRTGLLIFLGRLAEADAEARRSLAAALVVDPRLAVQAYMNLGAIAQRTGDEQAAWLMAAFVHRGAEYVTATRWTLPTEAGLDRYSPALAGRAEGMLGDAIVAVDAAHEASDPVAALGAWQREQRRRWTSTGDARYSPIIWGTLTTAWAPAPTVLG